MGGGPEDYGRRFVFITVESGRPRVVATGRGVSDSYILRPTFFGEGRRVLVLGETGAEFSWGLVAYDLVDESMRYLGWIDVVTPGDPEGDPLPYTHVRMEGDRYVVEFRTDLVLFDGPRGTTRLRRENEDPIVFEYREGSFVLVAK